MPSNDQSAGSPNLLQLGNQRREIVGDDLPEDVEVDVVVAVNQPVAQADNLRPQDAGIPHPLRRRHATGRFANDFEQPDEREI